MVKLNCLRHGEGVFFFTWGHDVLITGPELFDAEVGPLVRTLEGAATVPIKPSFPGTHVFDSLKSHFCLRPFLPNTVLWHCGHTGPSARPWAWGLRPSATRGGCEAPAAGGWPRAPAGQGPTLTAPPAGRAPQSPPAPTTRQLRIPPQRGAD